MKGVWNKQVRWMFSVRTLNELRVSQIVHKVCFIRFWLLNFMNVVGDEVMNIKSRMYFYPGFTHSNK